MRATANKKSIKSPKKNWRKQFAEKNYDSLVLPGPPLTPEQFRDWIVSRENSPTISLEEFEAQWAERKKVLLKLVK